MLRIQRGAIALLLMKPASRFTLLNIFFNLVPYLALIPKLRLPSFYGWVYTYSILSRLLHPTCVGLCPLGHSR